MLATIDTETGEIIDNSVKPQKPNRARENRDFVMMYRHYISQIAELGMQDVQALRVLLFLVRHMDTKNAIAVPMSLIADMLNISRQTVSTKVKYLQDHGWIQIMKLGKANVYVVNPDVVWTSYDDQKAYCQFEATVMMSSADNWEMRKKSDKMNIRHLDREVLKAFAEREFPDDTN